MKQLDTVNCDSSIRAIPTPFLAPKKLANFPGRKGTDKIQLRPRRGIRRACRQSSNSCVAERLHNGKRVYPKRRQKWEVRQRENANQINIYNYFFDPSLD
jgi:hypothetical protein